MDIDGYKLCALGLYRLCNAQRTRTVFCRKELREKVEARIGLFLGLKSAHTDRLFQLRENIGAILYRSKSQHTRTDFLDYETHATDRLKLCVIHKYNI